MAATSPQIASGFYSRDLLISTRRGTAQGSSLQVNLNSLPVPLFNQRKTSLPIMNPLVNDWDDADKSDYEEFTSEDLLMAARLGGKRLSAVGLAFTQQIQQMALRFSTNHQDVIEKLRILCARYLRLKLSENQLLTRRSCLQRLRSMGNIDFDPIYDDLMEKLLLLIQKLESQRPGLYDSIADQIGSNKLILSSPERASQALTILLEQIFKRGITWPKVAAMFACTGALAVDCAKRGKQDYTINLVNTVAEFSKSEVSDWIFDQGGWKSLLYRFNRESSWTKLGRFFTFAGPTIIALLAIYYASM